MTMTLVSNGGLNGFGVAAFLAALALSGLVIVPALHWLAARL